MSKKNLRLNDNDTRTMRNPTCHKCNSRNYCTIGKLNEQIENCPMKISPEIKNKAMKLYKTNEFIKTSTNVASIVEARGYIHWPRLKDTIEYAKGMGFKKLGIAFCIGLQKEAEKTAEILEKYGFQVCSVCCKTGSIKKVDVGVPEEFTMYSKTGYPIGFTSCNPVAQALILNNAKTEMNIIVGLCVGHDITFTNLSEAPVTTLIAKDRSNPHNSAAVLFTRYGESFFFKDLKDIKKEID
ncbi:MAG: DUF1847 domain-containing protein [Promethearchaeota archaeon]